MKKCVYRKNESKKKHSETYYVIKETKEKEGYKTVDVEIKTEDGDCKTVRIKGKELNKPKQSVYVDNRELSKRYNKLHKRISILNKLQYVLLVIVCKLASSFYKLYSRGIINIWIPVVLFVMIALIFIGGHWYLGHQELLLEKMESELDKNPAVRLNGQHYNEL